MLDFIQLSSNLDLVLMTISSFNIDFEKKKAMELVSELIQKGHFVAKQS